MNRESIAQSMRICHYTLCEVAGGTVSNDAQNPYSLGKALFSERLTQAAEHWRRIQEALAVALPES